MSKRFLVTTPKNPDFTGRTLGVMFHKGRAVVDDLTVDKRVGLTAEAVARLLKRDFKGYQVKAIREERPEPAEPRAKKSKAEKVEA